MLTNYLRARLRPKVAVTADPVTGLVTVKGKVAEKAYQYRTFEAPAPQVVVIDEYEKELPALIGFSTCVTCGALYARFCLACESGFTARG